jgi:hypothetical protein
MECNKCKKFLPPGAGNNYFLEYTLCDQCSHEFARLNNKKILDLIKNFIQPERLSVLDLKRCAIV